MTHRMQAVDCPARANVCSRLTLVPVLCPGQELVLIHDPDRLKRHG